MHDGLAFFAVLGLAALVDLVAGGLTARAKGWRP